MENCEHHWKSKQQVLRSTLTLKKQNKGLYDCHMREMGLQKC